MRAQRSALLHNPKCEVNWESSSLTDFFSNHTLTGQTHLARRNLLTSGVPPKCAALCSWSLRRGRCKLNSLAHSLAKFLEPGSRIGAVNHATQKSQTLRCVVTVSADVIFRDPCVQDEEAVHAPGLREDVSRVTKLRGFDDDGSLNIEDVFIPKQISPACPAGRAGDRKTDRNPARQLICATSKSPGRRSSRAHSLQLCFLDCSMFQKQADLIQRPRVLTEAMVDRSRRLQLLREVRWHFYIQTAGQRGFPSHQFPLAITLPVFARLDECALNLDLASQQMLPLVPSAVPMSLEGDGIEPELKFATRIAAQCQVVVEITLSAVGCGIAGALDPEKTPGCGGQRMSCRRGKALRLQEETPKPPYGNMAGASASASRRVIASPQFGMTDDVECPLQCHSFRMPRAD